MRICQMYRDSNRKVWDSKNIHLAIHTKYAIPKHPTVISPIKSFNLFVHLHPNHMSKLDCQSPTSNCLRTPCFGLLLRSDLLISTWVWLPRTAPQSGLDSRVVRDPQRNDGQPMQRREPNELRCKVNHMQRYLFPLPVSHTTFRSHHGFQTQIVLNPLQLLFHYY